MEPLLEARTIAVMRGRRAVLHDVSLCVNRAEIVALIGPNGSGKSTLLEVVVGARRPTEGALFGLGRPLTTIAARASLMAWVADDAVPEPERKVEHLLRPLGEERLSRLLEPLELRPLLDRRAGRLSRGERRRVTLAQALLLGRPLVVLDEPFGAFDALRMREIVAELRRWAIEGTAFLISIHQLEQAVRVADRSVLLHEGRVLAQGSEHELRETAGLGSGTLEDVVIALLSRARHDDAA